MLHGVLGEGWGRGLYRIPAAAQTPVVFIKSLLLSKYKWPLALFTFLKKYRAKTALGEARSHHGHCHRSIEKIQKFII